TGPGSMASRRMVRSSERRLAVVGLGAPWVRRLGHALGLALALGLGDDPDLAGGHVVGGLGLPVVFVLPRADLSGDDDAGSFGDLFGERFGLAFPRRAPPPGRCAVVCPLAGLVALAVRLGYGE